MRVSENELIGMLQRWDPDERPQHCSNCARARVFGPPDNPLCYCVCEYGTTMELLRMVRPKLPRGFRAANKCDDFASMSG